MTAAEAGEDADESKQGSPGRMMRQGHGSSHPRSLGNHSLDQSSPDTASAGATSTWVGVSRHHVLPERDGRQHHGLSLTELPSEHPAGEGELESSERI